jgi:DNA-binding LacI/PurR family transcriptional regulator
MRRLPTVTDVAEVAGVSRQTVSNVLNAPEIVRPETRERVQDAIARLGYRPHASARRLRTRMSSTLGVRLDPGADGMSGALLDRFLHALVERADRTGLRVLLYTAADEDAEIAVFERLLDGADVDALVLTSTHYGDRRIPWLVDHDVPFVTFGRPWGEHDTTDRSHRWVDVDGREGVRAGTASLLEQGLRRIAFLGWPEGSGTGDDRRAGWRDAMRAAGIAEQELRALDLAVEEDPHDLAVGGLALAAVTPPPEGVVCASDSLALSARLALGAGTAVIGYDDTPLARALGFSSVAQPLDDVAAAVLDLLRAEAGPHHRLLVPRLVVR